MLTKEEILQKIKNFPSLSSLIGETGALQELYNAVEEHANQDKWINCADRLPERDNSVLVAFDNGDVDHDWYDKQFNQWSRLRYSTRKITHWQPFPQKPITPCYSNYQ